MAAEKKTATSTPKRRTRRAASHGDQELLTRLHAAATEIAVRAETLVTGFGARTPLQEAETAALLATIRALGADPENPVPAAVMPGLIAES